MLVCALWSGSVGSFLALSSWETFFLLASDQWRVLLASDQGRNEGWSRLRVWARPLLSSVRLRLRRWSA